LHLSAQTHGRAVENFASVFTVVRCQDWAIQVKPISTRLCHKIDVAKASAANNCISTLQYNPNADHCRSVATLGLASIHAFIPSGSGTTVYGFFQVHRPAVA